jgi:hypothetical protein
MNNLQYATMFILVLLTHPGVFSFAPKFEETPVIGTLYQTFWVWLLNLPMYGSAAAQWTMTVLYYLVFGVYMYYTIRSSMMSARG